MHLIHLKRKPGLLIVIHWIHEHCCYAQTTYRSSNERSNIRIRPLIRTPIILNSDNSEMFEDSQSSECTAIPNSLEVEYGTDEWYTRRWSDGMFWWRKANAGSPIEVLSDPLVFALILVDYLVACINAFCLDFFNNGWDGYFRLALLCLQVGFLFRLLKSAQNTRVVIT